MSENEEPFRLSDSFIYWERGRPRPHRANMATERYSRFGLIAGEGARVPSEMVPSGSKLYLYPPALALNFLTSIGLILHLLASSFTNTFKMLPRRLGTLIALESTVSIR